MKYFPIVFLLSIIPSLVLAEFYKPQIKHVLQTPNRQNIVSYDIFVPLKKGYTILNQTLPTDSEELLKTGEKVSMTLRFQAVALGEISGITIQKSSGKPSLDKTAVDSLTKWRFKPSPYQRKVPLIFGTVIFEIQAI